IAIDSTIDESWLEGFTLGLEVVGREYGIALLGGDTVRTPGPLTLTATAFGTIETGRALRRKGGSAGDIVCVSGTIGDAALGLLAIQGGLQGISDKAAQYLAQRYSRPTPRVALGSRLVGVASAVVDISDGLVGDLGHICECSDIGMEINVESIPLSDGAKEALDLNPTLVQSVLSGGDDYELAFTVPENLMDLLKEVSKKAGVMVTDIGRTVEGAGSGRVSVFDDGKPVDVAIAGYRHF
ncbi:MAG: thiamine-phosphate kinase, partial [Rhodospirillales bacterium]|nr:thiamine-phosphate kinase [Rhodospirillales bacterium]